MLDNTDKRILEELKKDSRLSTGKISKKIGTPQTTIHHRIRKLIKKGIITKYTINIDKQKIGKNISAFVLVLFDTTIMKKENWDYEKLTADISKIEGIEEFAYTTGRYDIIIKVNSESMKELSDVILEKLRKIPGVSRTESIMIMKDFENGSQRIL